LCLAIEGSIQKIGTENGSSLNDKIYIAENPIQIGIALLRTLLSALKTLVKDSKIAIIDNFHV